MKTQRTHVDRMQELQTITAVEQRNRPNHILHLLITTLIIGFWVFIGTNSMTLLKVITLSGFATTSLWLLVWACLTRRSVKKIEDELITVGIVYDKTTTLSTLVCLGLTIPYIYVIISTVQLTMQPNVQNVQTNTVQTVYTQPAKTVEVAKVTETGGIVETQTPNVSNKHYVCNDNIKGKIEYRIVDNGEMLQITINGETEEAILANEYDNRVEYVVNDQSYIITDNGQKVMELDENHTVTSVRACKAI